MPAAHECARKILVFVITFTQFLCKHKFDIFLVWGVGVRRSCKSMASSCLESPLEENTLSLRRSIQKRGRMPSFLRNCISLTT